MDNYSRRPITKSWFSPKSIISKPPAMDGCRSSIIKVRSASKIINLTFSHDTTAVVAMPMQQLEPKRYIQRLRAIPSPDIPSRKFVHDVFVSFHGPDTRKKFTSHLLRGLENSNIKTICDYKIPRGDNIASSLFNAIENSRIAVIVLSPNFASSTWCLNETIKILECMHSRGQLVLPVFFHVNPSDIRAQTGKFKMYFQKLEEKYRDDLQKVERWRSALREVAMIHGWHITSDLVEAEYVQDIVRVVSSSLLED